MLYNWGLIIFKAIVRSESGSMDDRPCSGEYMLGIHSTAVFKRSSKFWHEVAFLGVMDVYYYVECIIVFIFSQEEHVYKAWEG